MIPNECRAVLSGILLCLVLMSGCGAQKSSTGPDGTRYQPRHGEFGSETVTVGLTKREYRLVVPRTVDLAKRAPLVVAFHGMAIDNKDVMPKYTKLNETAERHQFIIAHPNAVGGS